MKILEALKKVYNQSLLTKLLYWLLIAGLCLLISFGYEILFRSYKAHHIINLDDYISSVDYAGFSENEDGTHKAIIYEPAITYNFSQPIYIDKLDITFSYNDGPPIKYEVNSDTKFTARDDTFWAEVYPGETDVATVNAEVSRIIINVYDAYNRDFSVSIKATAFNPNLNYIRIILLSACLFLTFTVLTFITKIAKFKYQTIYLFFAIPMCLIFCFLFPPNYTPDEYNHLVRAIYLAQGQVEVKDDTVAYFPYNYQLLPLKNYRSIEDYYRYLEEFESPTGDNQNSTPEHVETTAKTYVFLPYITSAIGVKIAEILNLSAYYYVVLPRIINSILLLVLTYLGLMLFKGNRLLMLFLALFPTNFYYSCSSAHNALVIGTIILTISLVTYYKKTGKEISSWVYWTLIFLISCTTISRMTNGFYFWFLLLFPKDQFKSKFLRKWNTVFILIFTFVLMAYVYIYSAFIGGFTTTFYAGIDPTSQLKLILRKPITYFERFWVATEKLFSTNLFIDLMSFDFIKGESGIYALICVIWLVIVTLAGNPDNSQLSDLKSRIMIFLIFILCYGATVTAEYVTFTPLNSGTIYGMQARYIFPFFYTVLPCIEGKNFYLKANHTALVIGTLLVNLLFSLMAIGLILSKYYS